MNRCEPLVDSWLHNCGFCCSTICKLTPFGKALVFSYFSVAAVLISKEALASLQLPLLSRVTMWQHQSEG